jgi:hypothetical protein
LNEPIIFHIHTKRHINGDFTADTTESIFPQTYPHWVWHVEEEGGSEDLLRILQKFSSEQERIKLGKIDWDSIGDNDYYMELESGDFFTDKNMLQSLADRLNNYRHDLVICGYTLFNDKKASEISLRLPPEGEYENTGELLSMLSSDLHMFITTWGKLYKGSIVKEVMPHVEPDFNHVLYGAGTMQNLLFLEKAKDMVSIPKTIIYHCNREDTGIENGISPLWHKAYIAVYETLARLFTKWGMLTPSNSSCIDESWLFLMRALFDGIKKGKELDNPLFTIACLMTDPALDALATRHRNTLTQQAAMAVNGSPVVQKMASDEVYTHFPGFLAKSYTYENYKKIDGLLNLLAGVYHEKNIYFFGIDWLTEMLQCNPERFAPLMAVTNTEALKNKYLLRAIINGDYPLARNLCKETNFLTGNLLLAINAMPVLDTDYIETEKTAMLEAANSGNPQQAAQIGIDILNQSPLEIDVLINLAILSTAMKKKEKVLLFTGLIKIFYDDDAEALEEVEFFFQPVRT